MDPTKSDLQSPKDSAADSPLAKTFLLGPKSIRFRPFIAKPLIYAGYAASVCMGVAAYLSLGVTFVSSALAMFGASISASVLAIPFAAGLSGLILKRGIVRKNEKKKILDRLFSDPKPVPEHVDPAATQFMASVLHKLHPEMASRKVLFVHDKDASDRYMGVCSDNKRAALLFSFNKEAHFSPDMLKVPTGCSSFLETISHEVGHVVKGPLELRTSFCIAAGIDFATGLSKEQLLLSGSALALSAYLPEAEVFRAVVPDLLMAFATLSVSRYGAQRFHFMLSREGEFAADKFSAQRQGNMHFEISKGFSLTEISETMFYRHYPTATHPKSEFRQQAVDSHLAQISEAERLRRQEHVNKCVEAANAESGFKAALPYPVARAACTSTIPAL